MIAPINRYRVAAELAEAVQAHRMAIDSPDAEVETQAAERLERALEAATALLCAEYPPPVDELRPGTPILWLNTFGCRGGEPLCILRGRIIGQTYPLGVLTGNIERRYEAMIETVWGEDMAHTVVEGDIIPVSVIDYEARRAG
ncbi:hypothetical protein [Nocardia sp. CA-120079]|uniref:hypothetical protein n=1 Tax=Nocardia sp. CA-120079 TaxID=3239974 RepID=UPI003D970A0A